MVLKYIGRASNEYPLQIYEDIYRKIKTPKLINISLISMEYFLVELRKTVYQQWFYVPAAARHILLQLGLMI